jgi:hypothetical protein
MKLALIAFVALLLTACSDSSPRGEETGMGVVRSIDWYRRSFTHETDHGFVKEWRTCGEMPVWVGMRANIHLRWDNDPFAQCFRVDGVQR